jgi:hypothetical protein
MRSFTLRRVTWLLASTLLASTLAASAAAPGALTVWPPAVGDGPFDVRNLQWTRLELLARKLFLSARSEVRLEAVPAAEAAAELIESPQGVAVRPAGPSVLELTIESSGIGGHSTDSVWFNPRSADALQRLKIRHGGSKAYRKAVRFTDQGAFQLRTAPRNSSEARRPHTKWKKVEKSFFPHSAGYGCATVSEPAVLFYMLSARTADESQSVCVLSGRQVVPVSIETLGTERVAVDYEETRNGASERRTGEVEALRVAIRPQAGSEHFELLGLDGDVEIWIEKESRVPVEVHGKISGVGGVKIKLTAVELGEL